MNTIIWQNRWFRLRLWLPGAVCVWRGHTWHGEFCARCGEFLP